MILRDDEWHAVPDEGDLLECRTMARMDWRIGENRVITRVLDKATRSMRDGIYVPVYALASWIVDNWWALLYEPWPFAGPIPRPGVEVPPDVMSWMHRHNMRTAFAGYAGPYACIFSEGEEIRVVSRPDPRGLYVHTRAEFTEDFEVTGDRDALRFDFAQFIQWVLARTEGFVDERVEDLRVGWTAICNASADEAEFCRAAGRLGLFPYDTSDWPEGLVEWLEQVPDSG